MEAEEAEGSGRRQARPPPSPGASRPCARAATSRSSASTARRWNLVPIGTAMNKGLTLRMNQCNVKRYMPHLLEHIREGRIDARRIITHRFPLASARPRPTTCSRRGPGAASSACSCRTGRRDVAPAPGRTAHPLPPGGPGRIDDAEPTARPGVPMEHPPEPFPTAPERVVVQRPRVEVLQIPGRKKPVWVVSNAQPPRGLAGRLRRTGVPPSPSTTPSTGCCCSPRTDSR